MFPVSAHVSSAGSRQLGPSFARPVDQRSCPMSYQMAQRLQPASVEMFVPMIWLYRLFIQHNVFRACGSCAPGGRRKLELYSFRLLVDGLEVEVVPRGFCMQNEF